MNKLANAMILSLGFSAASAQADNFPNPFCTLNDKGVATVYTRVEAGEFRPEARSQAAVKREVGTWEGLKNAYHSARQDGVKPAPVTPVVGKTETYQSSTEMFVVGSPRGKQWVPEYEGAISVNIVGWLRGQALGTCSTASMATGDVNETMPIISTRDLPLISTGEVETRRYVEFAPQR